MPGDEPDAPEPRRALQAGGDAAVVGLDADAARAAELDSGVEPQVGPGAFTVDIDDVSVDGVRTIDLPRLSTGEVEASGDGAQRTVGGRTEYEDLEMERGVRKDESTLWDWRSTVEAGKVEEGRKTVTVLLGNGQGTERVGWEFSNAWPRGYEPPQLDVSADGDEVATESVTVTFERMTRVVESGPTGGVQASASPSAVLRYAATANAGRADDGAMVVTAGDAGVESVTLDAVEPPLTVDGGDASLLVPAGVRADEDRPGVLWLLPAGDPDRSAPVRVPSDAAGLYWVAAGDFFHDRRWHPSRSGGDDASPGERSIPGWPTDPGSDHRVLVVTGGRSVDSAFGSGESGGPPPGFRPAAGGETVPPDRTSVAVLGSGSPPFTGPALGTGGSGAGSVAALLDAGSPAPLAGATFGLATLSTPDASVAGQSANPLVGMETRELLQHEAARAALRRAGVTDADAVEWRVGPRQLGGLDDRAMTLLGTETRLESFAGVVNGTDGPWLVGVHVGRMTDGNHVVAAGVHRHPVGTVAGVPDDEGWRQLLARSRQFTVAVGDRLEYLE
jgi:phage tail-like protein